MKTVSRVGILTLVLISFLAMNIPAESPAPKVQIALLLDTSNSMDGLIAQAKSKLWSVVNEMARSKRDGKTIELDVALYEYGKSSLPQGEEYLRQIVPLTGDLDKISDELFKLTTNGGDEYCGAVIKAAVNGLKWSPNSNDLKIIFIAGNEPFTQGKDDYKTSCKTAIKKGIIVNTIFCGDHQEGINTQWKDGADLADGAYMNIDANQTLVHIDAPQDKELTVLNTKLNETYIAFGEEGKEKKELQAAQDANAGGVSSEVMAQRANAKASSQYRNSSWDLVDAKKDNSVKVENLPAAALPPEMQKMTKDERVKYVDEMAKKRDSIQKQITKLSEERQKYVDKQTKSQTESTLDAAMIKAVRAQAAKKNYKFE